MSMCGGLSVSAEKPMEARDDGFPGTISGCEPPDTVAENQT